MKKVVSSGSVLSVHQVPKFFRRGPRNDIQIIQNRIAWTNVTESGLSEQGADIYE